MTKTVQAPLDFKAPTKVGRRTFRKQIIRKGTIDYPMPDGTSRRVTFDDAYLDALELAHQQGAYDDVPFILADRDNAHTMDPTRFRGWIKGMERTPDGIDGILELSDDAAALVEATDYKLGVSPRIKAVTHVDGRTFPVAVNHVLGTLDPRLQGPTLGLKPWEPVDLASPDDAVLDLSSPTTGAPLNVKQTVRAMLDALKGTIDLSQEAGHGLEDELDPSENPVHAGWIDHVTENL